MVDYNNIESRYKSHCDTMEVAPPMDGWKRLDAALNARKGKKGILWLRLSGVAATLLLLLTVGSLIWWLPSAPDKTLTLQSTPPSPTDVAAPLAPSNNQPAGKKQHAAPANLLPDASLSQSRQLLSLASQNPSANKLAMPSDQRPEGEAMPYRSNHHSLKNYFTTDKIEVKQLKNAYPALNWADFYKVETPAETDTKQTTRFGRRIEVGGVYSPVYAFRQTSGPAGVPNTMLASAAPQESGLVYAGGGIRLNVMVNKKWSIESGVRFARLGQEVNSQMQVDELYAAASDDRSAGGTIKSISLSNSMGNIRQNNQPANTDMNLLYSANKANYHVEFSSATETSAQRLEQNLDYLEVPVTLRYYLVNKKMTLSLSAGFSTNWLISNSVYLNNNASRKNIGETAGLATMTVSSHAGMALTVPIVNRLSLQLEPRLNYFLSEINKDYPVTFRPYSFGVYSGLQYSFGK